MKFQTALINDKTTQNSSRDEDIKLEKLQITLSFPAAISMKCFPAPLPRHFQFHKTHHKTQMARR